MFDSAHFRDEVRHFHEGRSCFSAGKNQFDVGGARGCQESEIGLGEEAGRDGGQGFVADDQIIFSGRKHGFNPSQSLTSGLLFLRGWRLGDKSKRAQGLIGDLVGKPFLKCADFGRAGGFQKLAEVDAETCAGGAEAKTESGGGLSFSRADIELEVALH